MTQLNKISNSNFDTDKPVILCGKGPSLDRLGDFLQSNNSNDFYFCSINTAYKLMPQVDFLSFSDIMVLEELDKRPDDYLKIKNFVCPIVLREAYTRDDGKGDVRESDKTFQFVLDKTTHLNGRVYTYTFFTQNRQVEVDKFSQDNFYINWVVSSYQTTLLWLIEAGFRKFEIFGVSQRREYHKTFVEDNDCGNRRKNEVYRSNIYLGLDIMNKHQCKYTHN